MPSLAEDIANSVAEDMRSEGRFRLIEGLDGDKRKAAESYGLSRGTGTDPLRIYTDFDAFKRKQKSDLGQTLAEEDSALTEYLRKHPLGSVVSQDDWGALSEYAEKVRAFYDIADRGAQYFPPYYIAKNIASMPARGLITSIMQEQPEMIADFLESSSYQGPEILQGGMRFTASTIREFAKTGIPAWAERRTKTWDDIDSTYRALEWAFESLGATVGSAVPAIAAGAGGLVAGTAVGGPIGGGIGAVVGAGSVSYVMSTGELYGELIKEGLDPKFASNVAHLGAIPIAGADVVSLGVIGRAAGLIGAKKQISQTFARVVAKAVASGAASEGITESAQEIMQNIIVDLAAGRTPTIESATKGALEAGVAGAIGGAALGGAGKAYTQSSELRKMRSVLNDINRTIEEIEPWLKAGEAIPQGANANIDQLIALHSVLKLDAAQAFIEHANKTETKELSPEAFRELAGIQFGDQKAYIRWDAVKAIYGEELPAPDDNKLGWIPDMGRKFERAQRFGEPIEVKLADLVAADPEAYKLIQDDFFVEDGMSRKEAEEKLKEKPQFSSIHETELPGLAQDLRRPFVLKDVGEGLHDVVDEAGQKTGQIRVIEQGKNLFIGWEKGQYDTAGLITLMNQLKQKFPNAETISTVRIPGVRSLERDLEGSTIGVDMPFRIKERPVDVVRRAMWVEPLFDLSDEGPRAIRMVRGPAPGRFLGYGQEPWTITDEVGRPIASLEINLRDGGKEVNIGWIGTALAEPGATLTPEGLINKLGPSLVRSLVRQIKENYPDAKRITGTRVSGAREKREVAREKAESEAGKVPRIWAGDKITIDLEDLLNEMEKMPAAWHPTDIAGPETEKLFELISQGYTRFGDAWVKPLEPMSLSEAKFIEGIQKFLEKTIGKGRAHIIAAEHILKDVGTQRERGTAGLFQFGRDVTPFITWSIEAPDPYTTAGHEAIHFLRHYQYIRPEEWEILKKAAEEQGWLDRPEMERYARYRETQPELYYEEAIADEFKRWAKMDRENQQLHGMAKFFQKILDFIDHMKSVYREITGQEPTAENIMRDIQLGRMAGREPLGVSEERMKMFGLAKAEGLAEELADEKLPPIEQIPTFAPGAVMDKKQYARYQRLLNEQNANDIRIEREKAVKEANRRNAPEWKANREEMRKNVETEIGQRPDFRARAFFQNGTFYGASTHYMPKVDPKLLTKEQRLQFPARWQERGGMNPDDLAQPFGFQTGSNMIDALIRFEKEKGSLTPKEFIERTVDKETDRRMEQKYGDLAARNLEEAMDQVVGNTQMDLLHQEMLALGLRAGMSLSISREDIKSMAFSSFLESPQTEGTYKHFMRELYRTGKAAESRFLVGDYIGAFQEKWMQVHLFEMARQVKQLDKEKAQLERAAKRFYKRYPDNFPAEFTEFIQLLLRKAGYEVDRGPGDLERMFATRDHKGDLREFVKTMNELPPGSEDFETALEPYLIIPDFILDDPNWSKNAKDMTVGELKAFNSAIQSLQKIGAHQGKLHRLGEEADLQKMLEKAKKQLYAVGPEKPVKRPGKRKTLLQWYHKGTIAPEDLAARLDKGDEEGFFTQFWIDPFSDASYTFDQSHKEFRKKRIEIDKKYGGTSNRSIPNNVFVDPTRLKTDEEGKVIPPRRRDYIPATHQMLRTVLLNWGNKSNRERLTEGHFIESEAAVDAWIAKYATKEDWQWAQAIGQLYNEIYDLASEVTMRESNTMVERIPLPQIDTPFGKMDGWYYPIHYDRSKDGGPKRTEVVAPPRLARTYRGWERKRTGSAGPLDLTIDPLDLDMNKRLHDIAYREVLRDFRKIKNDRGLRRAMEIHMGRSYVEMLDNFHDDIALPYRPNSGALQGANKYVELARQNVIMTLVGFSTGTFMKHVPSTAAQSWARVGVFKQDFYSSAIEFMPVHPRFIENWRFVYSGGKVGSIDHPGSREIQKRWKHYATAHGLDHNAFTPGNLFWKTRDMIINWGAMPVAAGDILSSVILWNAVYKKQMRQYMAEGMTLEEAHVKADTRADFAVRQTHGSTSIVRRPEFMRRADTFSRWFTSLFSYYNHVYGQLYRMAWRSKDFAGERYRKEPTTQKMNEYISEMTSLSMAYVILPAAFYWFAQDFLLGKEDDEDESLVYKIAKPVIHNVGGAVLGVRDVIGFLTGGGQQPVPGIIGVPLQQVWNFARHFDPEKEWKEADPGKVIRHLHGTLGVLTGMSSNQVGMWNQFLYNYMQAVEEPEEPADWYRAFRRGTIERRKQH